MNRKLTLDIMDAAKNYIDGTGLVKFRLDQVQSVKLSMAIKDKHGKVSLGVEQAIADNAIEKVLALDQAVADRALDRQLDRFFDAHDRLFEKITN